MSDQIYLEFTDKDQEAIVGHLLSNYSFFQKCRASIKFAWFQRPEMAEIVKITYELWDSLDQKRQLTVDEVKSSIHKAHIVDNKKVKELHSALDLCLITSKSIGLDILARNMTGWLRIVTFKNSILKAEEIYNKKAFDKGIPWVASQMQEILNLSFEPDDSADFKDLFGFLDKRQVDMSDCMTMGHPEFDELLMRDSKIEPCHNYKLKWNPNDLATQTKGSLARGDTTILVGSSNAGKTSTIISVIFANITYFKRNILYYTHEQKEDDIKYRILQSFTSLKSQEIANLRNNETHTKNSLYVYQLLDKHLTYVPYTKPTKMFVEDVIASIETKQAELIAKTGKGYDMLIIDYPGKLKSRHYSGKNSSGWEEMGYIYDRFVNLGLHYNFHVFLATQTNREGYKINRGDTDRMIDQDDIGKSYEIAQIASNVITINRSPTDIAQGIVRFHVAKCRSATPKWTFVSAANYDVCRTHGPGMRCLQLAPGKTLTSEMINTLFPDNPSVVKQEQEALKKEKPDEPHDKSVAFTPNSGIMKA